MNCTAIVTIVIMNVLKATKEITIVTKQEFQLLKQLVAKFENHCKNVEVLINIYEPDNYDEEEHSFVNKIISDVTDFERLADVYDITSSLK